MEPFLLAVLGLTGAAAAFGLSRRREQDRAQRWKRQAEEAGLSSIRAGVSFPSGAFLDGGRGRHAVHMERYKRGKSSRGTRITVKGLAKGLSLKSEGLGSTVEKTLGGREVETGDRLFDDAIFTRGPEALLRALLDAETRRAVKDVFAGRVQPDWTPARTVDVSVWVADGELRAEIHDRWGRGDRAEADALKSLLALAERLAPPDRLDLKLAENARADPEPTVRRHALATLEREYEGSPATREAMAAALRDEDPDVRLRAGLWMGEEGRPVLEELAASQAAPDATSARAVAGLGDHLAGPLARGVLEGALRAGRVETAKAAVASLARGGAEAVDAIAPALAGSSDAVAVAAADALGAIPSPLAEDALLSALERGPDPVRLAAARALGRVGTVRAVLPLRELQEHGRGGDKAAREAVALIQSRLTGATPGQLALTGDDASGHVSLADDSNGRVTLADE
jgi:HEAT repeat protein